MPGYPVSAVNKMQADPRSKWPRTTTFIGTTETEQDLRRGYHNHIVAGAAFSSVRHTRQCQCSEDRIGPTGGFMELINLGVFEVVKPGMCQTSS